MAGGGLGAGASSMSARTGASASETTAWVSDTAVSLMSCRGHVASQEPLVLTLVQQAGSTTSLCSYDQGMASSVSRSNGPASGGALATISGSGMASFDASVRARVGASLCRVNTWVSETSVVCGVSAGVSNELGVRIEVQGIAGRTVTGAYSYDLPKVSSVQPLFSPTTGNTLLYLAGTDFGTYDSTVRIRVGDTECYESTYVSDKVLSCRVAPGVGGAHSVKATIHRQVADSFHLLFSYKKPEVFLLVEANSPSLGGRITTIFGDSFGLFDHTVQHRVGGSASAASLWMSETTSSLKSVAGVDQQRVHVLSVHWQWKTSMPTYSFDAPAVSSVSIANIAPAFFQMLTVAGSEFFS
ncbi:MAG: IPT/TIG domain-containing protein, partial [Promethearchaeia archaeon]